jgi:hypothetical protein
MKLAKAIAAIWGFIFSPELWQCPKCKQLYKPSRGELMRLQYWGVSGAADGHDCPVARVVEE